MLHALLVAAAGRPSSVTDHHLNHASQNVLTFVSWALTVVLLAVAVRMGRRERTPFYVLIVLASMVGAFAEPIYDTAFSLYFYSNHGMQTFYTAFGVPQPIWTHSGYAILYASPAVYITHKIRTRGVTPRALFAFAGIEVLMSCVFEIIAINIGTYTYWGPHVLRIDHYPIVIAVLEAAQVMCYTVAAAQLRQRAVSPWALAGLFVVFPITFLGANFGAGAAEIIGIHLQQVNTTAVYLTTLLSIVFAAVLVRFAGAFLPARADAGDDARPSAIPPVLPVTVETAPEAARA